MKLRKLWLAEFVRQVADSLSPREKRFMSALLWGVGRAKVRTTTDLCSELQRRGLVKPTRAKRIVIVESLTPLGILVRGHMESTAEVAVLWEPRFSAR